MWLRILLINLALLIIFALSANAEGTIKKLHIKSSTVYRFNTVKINSRIKNEKSTRDKLVFQIALPSEAFVTGFSMTLKNIHMEGRIVEQIKKMLTNKKKKEREPYGNRPRSTSQFKIIIHAPPTVVATFSLTYQNMLQRRHSVYDQTLYITPGQIVEDLQVNSFIYETRDIVNLKVHPLRGELVSDHHDETAENEISEVNLAARTANITFRPSVEEQRAFSENGINGLYTITYDILRAKDKGDIILWNGYFMHFFAPSGLTALNKDVVFVLDDSTSMTGNKLKQMKEAMYEIIDSLHENDRFHFVQFSHKITPRRSGFVEGSRQNIEAAKEYVRNTFIARGATNVNDAIIEGLKSFNRIEYMPEARSSILVFLTDGRPTVGEKIPEKILENIKKHNRKNVQIFSISFGADADYSLIQKISYLNEGVPRRIYEASDSALQMKRFFSEISSILIRGLKFDYDSSYVLTEDIAWSMFKNYYEGSEIMISGKVSDYNMRELGVTVKETKSGNPREVDYLSDAITINDKPSWMTIEEYKRTMARMWAFLTLKHWMRLKIIGGSAFYMEKLERRIRELSTKYSFLAEGASMIMSSSETDEATLRKIGQPEFARDLYGEARVSGGGSMRVFADPHFMVNLPELDIPVCFEIIADEGDFLLLVEDPVSGVRVTASVIKSPSRNKDGRHKTYIGEVFVSTIDLQVRISPYKIRLNGLPLSWNLENSLGSHRLRVVVTGSGSHVSLIINNSTQMLIQRYMYALHNPKQVNYLNFYVTDHTGLSQKTTGLLGYFAHAHVNNTTPTPTGMEHPHTLHLSAANRVTGKTYPFEANLIDRLDVFDIEHTVRCWKVLPHENSALFGGAQTGSFFLDDL